MEYEVYDVKRTENGQKDPKDTAKVPPKKVKWERRDVNEFGFVIADAVHLDTGGLNFLNTKKKTKKCQKNS